MAATFSSRTRIGMGILQVGTLMLCMTPIVTGQSYPFEPEFQIAAAESNYASIAVAPDGGFAVAWNTSDALGEVLVQRFSAIGVPASLPISVASLSQSSFPVRVEVAPSGEILVVWTDDVNSQKDGSGSGVFARLYASDGAPLGGEFQVNTLVHGDQGLGSGDGRSVAMDADGNSVVVWTGYVGGICNVYAQRLSSDGSHMGPEIRVNSTVRPCWGGHSYAVDASDTGEFVVVWASHTIGGGVMGQRFSSTGAFAGEEFLANSSPDDGEQGVSVAMSDATHDFMVVWSTDQSSIAGRRFANDGTPVGDELLIAPPEDPLLQGGPYAAAKSEGGFVIAWHVSDFVTPGARQHIMVRQYASDGQPLADASQANSLGGDHVLPKVGTDANGGFTLIWYGGDTNNLGNFVRQYRTPPCSIATDIDSDLFGDSCDICMLSYNPDQLNSDCPDAGLFVAGGCAGNVPSSKAGCCDGGDLCDPCPATIDNTQCAPSRTTAASIGPVGGIVTTPNGQVTVSVPADILMRDTSISVTDNGPRSSFTLERGSQTVYSISARPEGHHFPLPVAVTFSWPDANNDGVVDGSTRPELKLALRRNISRFSKAGVGVSPFLCEDHLLGNGCESAVAFCGDPVGTGKATVANCCDPIANTWTFQTCDFSEYVLGLEEDDLVPGGGSPKTDCFIEWRIENPYNTPTVDRRGLPTAQQVCRDGDRTCDKDNAADGRCVFSVSPCLNNEDSRLRDRAGTAACTVADVATVAVKKPKPNSRRIEERNAAIALRDAMSAFDASSTLTGKHGEEVTFPAPLNEHLCTAPISITVPIRGAKGTQVIRTQAVTSPVGGSGRPQRDADKLKLVCLPALP